MKIYQLRLINVKSYVDETLHFQEGINFISGINGAGKSTIIESIGYGLFNYNPYLLKQFLREGASQGEIQVLIEGPDERFYRIIRRFNATASLKWEVWDEETSTMLDELHGADDVALWLKQTMGINPVDSLPDLFRQVIAVSQGQFTTPFLEAPGPRTKTFDAVLKVDDFRQAFERTSPLERELANEGDILERELVLLDQQLVELPIVEEDIKKGQLLRKAKGAELAELTKVLTTDGELLAEMVKKKTELEQLSQELAILAAELKGIEQQITSVASDLEAATRSQNLVATNEAGFSRYQQTQKDLAILEKQAAAKEKLVKQINDVQLNIAKAVAKLESEEKSWEDEKRALEEALQENKKQFAAAGGKVEYWQKNSLSFKSWHHLKTHWRPVLARQSHWLQNQHSTIDEARQIRQRLADLKLELQEQASYLEQLPGWEKELAELQRQENLATLQKKEMALAGELDALLRNEEHLLEGVCPIIQEACPSERITNGLAGFFQAKRDDLRQELAKLKPEIAKAHELQEKGKALQIQIAGAKQQQIRFQQGEGRYQQLWQRVKSALKALPWEELEEISTGLGKLKEFYRTQGEMLAEAVAKWELGPLPDLPAQPGQLSLPTLPTFETLEELGEWLNTFASWEGEVNLLAKAWMEYGQAWSVMLNQIESKLDAQLALAQEREAQLAKEKLELAAKEKGLQEKKEAMAGAAEQIEGARENLAKLMAEEAKFGDLAAELKEKKAALAKDLEAYTIYQTNIQVARKLPELQGRSAELKKEQADLTKKQGELSEKKTRLSKDYSEQAHSELSRKVEEGKSAQLELRRDLAELKRRDDELSARLAKLLEVKQFRDKKQEQLLHTSKAQEFTKVFRQVLRAAADPIAQQYRNYLSQVATEIYRTISGENVSVEWASQYELQLVDYLDGKERVRLFRQLSGGEQMTAALAIRLALMQVLSPVKLGFFDEPTTNLDLKRRESLALAIQNATTYFEQLFLISHDDTFDTVTESVIALTKGGAEGTKAAGSV